MPGFMPTPASRSVIKAVVLCVSILAVPKRRWPRCCNASRRRYKIATLLINHGTVVFYLLPESRLVHPRHIAFGGFNGFPHLAPVACHLAFFIGFCIKPMLWLFA